MHRHSPRAPLAGVVAALFACLTFANRAMAVSGPVCAGFTCSGGTPHVVTSGTGLPDAEVAPIFWGVAWKNANAAKVYATLLNAANGPYFAALGQYGIGPVRISPIAPFDTSVNTIAHCANGVQCTSTCADNSQCGASDVIKKINSLIGLGAVSPPATLSAPRGSSPSMMYLVMVGGTNFAQVDYNGVGICDATCGSYSGVAYHFGWAGENDAAGMTHELVESIAGNVGIDNCTSNGSTLQVADICGCLISPQINGNYASYWSKADSACVVPEGYTSLYRYDPVKKTWTNIADRTFRQIYTGPHPPIATDRNDDLYQYVGHGAWSKIDSTDAPMYAVDASGYVRLAADGLSIARYDGASWRDLGAPAGHFLTGVYGGKFIVASETRGIAGIYDNAAKTWSLSGLDMSAQVAVNMAGVYELSQDHGFIRFNSTGRTNGWSNIGNLWAQIFTGADTAIAATDIATKDIYYYSGTWTHQGAAGNSFGVTTGSTGLYRTSLDQAHVYQSDNVTINTPTWTGVGKFRSRLYGGDTMVYATTDLEY